MSQCVKYFVYSASVPIYKYDNNNKAHVERLTSFVIDAKELLVLSDRDCLKCNVSTQQGNIYEDVLIDNTDWHSKQRFLKAVGHSDCVFLESDNELRKQVLFAHKFLIRKSIDCTSLYHIKKEFLHFDSDNC